MVRERKFTLGPEQLVADKDFFSFAIVGAIASFLCAQGSRGPPVRTYDGRRVNF